MKGKKRKKSSEGDEAPIEAELRLAGEADVLGDVFASPLMAQADEGQEKVVDLENRYFDTPDRDLHAQGLALRVRVNGVGFQQTLKAGDDAKAALLKRSEWEVALDNDQLKLDAFPKAAQKMLPKAAWNGDLSHALTTRIRRRLRNVTLNDQGRPSSDVEAVLDLGEIEVGTDILPVAEIELELTRGSPGDLYRLALDLHDIAPLHLETRSKSARAFDRLAERPPSWHGGSTPSISRSDSIDEAMAAIFESCFKHWLANQAAAFDGRDPEGVHQMRVALRRLRSALSVFGELIPPDQADWLRAGAKAAISGLGPARDWDVFQDQLLAPLLAARPDDRDLRLLRTKARSRGRTSHRAAQKMLQGADYTRFALRFGHWLEERAWRETEDARQASRQAEPIVGFARHLLDKRLKRALGKGRNFAELTVEKRHELRITLKKLRYAIEFFKPLFGKKAAKPFLACVKGLQDDFGHLNDVAVAEALLGELLAKQGKQDIRQAAGMVIGWHASGIEAAEPSLLEHWERFRQQLPFWR